jgi:hypothetical protein
VILCIRVFVRTGDNEGFNYGYVMQIYARQCPCHDQGRQLGGQGSHAKIHFERAAGAYWTVAAPPFSFTIVAAHADGKKLAKRLYLHRAARKHRGNPRADNDGRRSCRDGFEFPHRFGRVFTRATALLISIYQ